MQKVLFSTYLSNSLEFFDYTLFAALAPIIQQTFFKNIAWITPFNLTLFAFCISLIVRPIGGLLFGYIGDTVSRLVSLRLSIGCMTLASLLLACLPDQDIIGNSAVWLVFFSRVLQGISAGGEYNGAAIFTLETYAKQNWLMSGFMTSSAMMGLVLASLAAFLLNYGILPEYTWRLFFGFGALIGISSFILRTVNTPSIQSTNIASSVSFKFLAFYTVFFIGGQTSALSYFVFVNLKNMLTQFPILKAYNMHLLIGGCFGITAMTSIFFGWLAQRYFQAALMRFAIWCIIVISPWCLWAFSKQSLSITLFSLISLALLISLHGSCQHAFFQKYIKTTSKQRTISFAFSLGTGILSSFVIWASNYCNLLEPNAFIFIFSAISLCAAICIHQLEKKYAVSYSQPPSNDLPRATLTA